MIWYFGGSARRADEPFRQLLFGAGNGSFSMQLNADMMNEFSHIDDTGAPRMVDITEKSVRSREAVAEARVRFPEEAVAHLEAGGWTTAKGPVLHTAVIAGTQAAKRTADLIPFCHPLPLESCTFTHEVRGPVLVLACRVKTSYKTGVEMEAFVGVSVAACTVIDMCKSLSPAIEIETIRLLSKTGGKSDYEAAARP